jgi:hypothetical protein
MIFAHIHVFHDLAGTRKPRGHQYGVRFVVVQGSEGPVGQLGTPQRLAGLQNQIPKLKMLKVALCWGLVEFVPDHYVVSSQV